MALIERLRAAFAPQKPLPAASPLPDVPTAAPAKAMTGDVVWSESIIYANSDWPKYNPDELIRGRGYKIYAQMMLDEQIKAVVRFKRDAITARRWYFDVKPKTKPDDGEEVKQPDKNQPGTYRRRKVFKFRHGRYLAPPAPNAPPAGAPAVGQAPPEPEPKDPEQVELEKRAYVLEACIEQMEGSLLDGLNGIMSAMQNGFSMTEKVLQQIDVDGKTWWGIKHLRVKPFNSFYFYVDEFGNLDRVLQRWEGKEQEVDPDKFIHHVQNPDVDLHYGASELREAYRAWFSKDIAIRFWNIHLERHASGFFIIEPEKDSPVNIKAGTVEYNAIVQVLNNLSVKSGILLPNGVKGRLEKPNNTDAYEKAIASHDKAIAKALLVPNLLGITEQGQTGSYSQSQTQLEAFLWTLDAEASRLEESINEQLIKEICELNFPDGPCPKFCFEPISDALKLQIIKQWGELVRYGAVQHTDSDEEHIRDLIDFPEAGTPVTAPIPPALHPSANPNADPNADPNDPNAKDGKPGKPPTAGQKPAPGDKTIVGQSGVRTSRKAFAQAVRRVDFAIIERTATSIEQRFTEKLDEVLRQGVTSMRTFIKGHDLKNNPDLVADVQLNASTKRKLSEIVRAALSSSWSLGIDQADREIRRAKGDKFDRGDQGPLANKAEQFLDSRAQTFADDISGNLRKKVATILYSGIKGDWTVDEMVSRIDDLVDSESIPQLTTAVRTLTFEAINEARYDFFTQPSLDNYVQAFEFSAIIDGKTTEICQHMDGSVYDVDSDVWSSYTPPLHFNCRSLLIPVTVDDTWTESPAPKVQPEEGFGG